DCFRLPVDSQLLVRGRVCAAAAGRGSAAGPAGASSRRWGERPVRNLPGALVADRRTVAVLSVPELFAQRRGVVSALPARPPASQATGGFQAVVADGHVRRVPTRADAGRGVSAGARAA